MSSLNLTSVQLSDQVKEAKQRLPLPSLLKQVGLGKHAKASCCSPLREDKNPSWGVFEEDGLWFWKDHGTGESGDEVTFIERLHGCTRADAMRRFCEMAGVDTQSFAKPESSRRGKPTIPATVEPQEADIETLSVLRNVSPTAINAALDAGLLFFCKQSGYHAWGVTDCTRQNAQLRRLDGEVWPIEWNAVGGKKAWTLRHSRAAWPLGVKEADNFPKVTLLEGGPDLLAAFHFIHLEGKADTVAPIAILGAGNDIPPKALPHFGGKHVRIFGHDDKEGQHALQRWAHQLMDEGATVDAFSFSGLHQMDGNPVVDLNDLCNISADDFEDNPHLQEIMP
jgi:hypothetical protein